MINISPPKELASPVRVERLLVHSGKPVVQGEPLIFVSGMDGRRATIAAQMDGTVFFPSTVFEGAQIPYGQVIISMNVDETLRRQQTSTAAPQTQAPHTQAPQPRSPNAPSRGEKTVEASGGFLSNVVTAFSCLLLALTLNALFRIGLPDLSIEELLLFSGGSVGLSAGLIALMINKRQKTASTGQVLSLMTAATLGFGLGLVPDDEIRFRTGYQPSDLADIFTPGGSAHASSPTDILRAEPLHPAAAQPVAEVKPVPSSAPLHAWFEGSQSEPHYIKYMEGTVALGADVVKRDGPFDKVYLLDSGDHGMSRAIIQSCDTRNDNKWAEIVEISNGQFETIRRYNDRCARPCTSCSDADIILLDIHGTDSRGRPKIDREYVNASGIIRRQKHQGVQSEYCAFDWRRCN